MREHPVACGAALALAHVLSPLAHGAGAVIVAPRPVGACLRPGDGPAPAIAACAAPGADPEYVAAFYDWMLAQSGLTDYFTTTRWSNTILGGNTALGSPTTVTYSFPSDALGGISGGQTTQNQLNAKMVQWFGSVANGKARFRVVFDRWEALSGLRYVETSDDDAGWFMGGALGFRGEIRIVSIVIDGGSNTLAFNFFPPNGDMVLDAADAFGSFNDDYLFFRNVVAHEAGHGFGLLHVCPTLGTKIMEPQISTAYDGPRHDDVRAVQAQYGDTIENNDTFATATDLGVLPSFVAITNLSINSQTDPDILRFVAPAIEGAVDIVATPIGFQYDSSPQNGNCTTGNIIDSLLVQDLALDVLAGDGVTVLATSNSAGLGGVERVLGHALAPGASRFVRVRSVGLGSLGNQTQMYRLDINPAAPAPCPGDANGDDAVNFLDLNIVLGQFGQSGSGLAGDVTGDGVVNFVDLNLVLSNFGVSC